VSASLAGFIDCFEMSRTQVVKVKVDAVNAECIQTHHSVKRLWAFAGSIAAIRNRGWKIWLLVLLAALASVRNYSNFCVPEDCCTCWAARHSGVPRCAMVTCRFSDARMRLSLA